MWKAQNRRTFDRKGCAVPVTRPSGMGPGPPLHFFCAARIGPAEQVDLIEVLSRTPQMDRLPANLLALFIKQIQRLAQQGAGSFYFHPLHPP